MRVRVLLLAAMFASVQAQQFFSIQTSAGTDFAGDGGPAITAALSQAEGVAIDSLGAIYVADAGDHRIRRITPDGIIQTVAGTGVAGFAGDGGQASAALLNHPYGIAVDSMRNLYVADLGNARIRRIAADGTIQTVAGGGSIVPGGNGDGGPATSAQLLQPRNVAITPDGTLYFSDFGTHRVLRVSPNGIITTLAGNGNSGFSGDGGSALLAQLKSPAGVTVDSSGAVYIADSGNNRVRRVFQGVIGTVYNVAGPTGVAAANGTVYIASASYVGTPFKALAGISSAKDIGVDAIGNVFASVGQFVRKISSDGKLSTIAGSGSSPYFAGDGGPAVSARLHGPSGITLDGAGNFYLADTANNRIRKIAVSGVISTFAGSGVAGLLGDNGPASQAQLNAPRSVAIDSLNNLYIADSGNNRIRVVTAAGVISTFTAQVSDPSYVAVDGPGNVYVADTGNNRVIKLTPMRVLSTLTQVFQPAAVTVDTAGNVFFSETGRVSKIAPSGTVSSVLAGLNSPGGLAVSQNGDLLIAETGVNTVRMFSATGALTTIAGNGAAGFAGDGGPATAALFNTPMDLATDLTGAIYVADNGNNRVRVLTPTVVSDSTLGLTIVNGATLAPGPVAPGEIVTVFGAGFDPAGTQLEFDGQPAAVFYVGPSQINALAPNALRPGSSTSVKAVSRGVTVGSVACAVVPSSPGLFTTGNGSGLVAANNEDGSVNSSINPADRGSVVSLYATGEGSEVSSVVLKIAGYTADLLYAGPAPGFPGLMQINARIPAGFAPTGMLPVAMTIGTMTTQPNVTIAVR